MDDIQIPECFSPESLGKAFDGAIAIQKRWNEERQLPANLFDFVTTLTTTHYNQLAEILDCRGPSDNLTSDDHVAYMLQHSLIEGIVMGFLLAHERPAGLVQ